MGLFTKVEATAFLERYTDEPHASRRKEILKKHPEIKQLMAPEPLTKYCVLVAVVLQTGVAYALRNSSWKTILFVSYAFGAFANHYLFLAIHEISHNLAFKTRILNRLLSITANFPIVIPYAISFRKYHQEHHKYQGDDIDTDIPSQWECDTFTTPLLKWAWAFTQILFYALRPPLVRPMAPTLWDAVNAAAVIAFDYAIYVYSGTLSPLGYLLLSTFFAGSIHPAAGHFISEHYIFTPNQETYSYYGPMNLISFNVGYHNEHHDFPNVPWTALPKVRKIAPEFYDNLVSYNSWVKVIWDYLINPSIGPYSRMKRAQAAQKKEK